MVNPTKLWKSLPTRYRYDSQDSTTHRFFLCFGAAFTTAQSVKAWDGGKDGPFGLGGFGCCAYLTNVSVFWQDNGYNAGTADDTTDNGLAQSNDGIMLTISLWGVT